MSYTCWDTIDLCVSDRRWLDHGASSSLNHLSASLLLLLQINYKVYLNCNQYNRGTITSVVQPDFSAYVIMHVIAVTIIII